MKSAGLLLTLLFLFNANVNAYDMNEIEVTNSQDLMQIIPSAWMNQVGFKMEDGVGFRSADLAAADFAFPFFPMFKSEYMGISKKFVGVVVPEKFLGLEPFNSSNDKNITRTMACDLHPVPKVREACQAMRRMGLAPEFHKNKVYGLKVRGVGQVIRGRSTTIGINLLPSFDSDDTFDFTDKSEWTISPLQNLANIFTGFNNLVNPPKATEALEETLKLLPYLQAFMRHNQTYEVLQGGALIPAKKSSEVEVNIPEKPLVKMRVSASDFSKELQNSLLEYYRNINDELKWKSQISVAFMAQLTPVIADEESNRLIQQICDYMASAYGTVEELWPRCRIMASLDANAFALPSGDIFISAGLLGIISDLDGAMHVLGHEIGHNIGRHLTKRFKAIGIIQPPLVAIGIAGNAFALSGGLGVLGPVSAITWFPQMMGASQMAGIAGTIINLGVMSGLMYHSREHERQSDRFGHEVAFATGANQEGIEKGWLEFKGYVEDYYGVRGGWLNALLESHPRMGERVKNIRDEVGRYQNVIVKYKDASGDHANRLLNDFYERYSHLHNDFKPYAQAYGKYIKRKLEEKNSKFAEYSKASLISPAGSCLMHALGGID